MRGPDHDSEHTVRDGAYYISQREGQGAEIRTSSPSSTLACCKTGVLETTTTASGVDLMSIGRLTHSAQVLDIGLDHLG